MKKVLPLSNENASRCHVRNVSAPREKKISTVTSAPYLPYTNTLSLCDVICSDNYWRQNKYEHMFKITKYLVYHIVILHTIFNNTLRPRQNGRHFPDDIFKCIFLNEYVWILIKISPIFFLKVRVNNILALVQITAWRRPGDKPLSEPMMV